MDDEVLELRFYNPASKATAILTFTPLLDSGQVNLNVSLRHDEGLSPLKAHRYASMWFKWGGKCLRDGLGDPPSLPALPSGWID